jgi:hypothetical protein
MHSNYANQVLDRIALLYLYFKKLLTILAIRMIKRKARKYAKKYKCQVFVINHQGHIRLITRRKFKWLRQHGIFRKEMTAKELKESSLYYCGHDKKRV